METHVREAVPATQPVYWIPLDEALRHFHAERADIVAAVKRGELSSKRIVCGDELEVALSSAELAVRWSRRSAPLPRPLRAQVPPPIAVDPRVTQLEERLAAEREARARAEGELASADRVERAVQRYADRLEGELERTRKQMLSLARALGRAEQLAASAGLRLPGGAESRP